MAGRIVVSVTLLLGLVAGAIAWWHHVMHPGAPQATVSITRPAPEPDPAMLRVVSSGPMARPRDHFRLIDRPEFLSVDAAAGSMSDDEVVIGLEFAGEARAYPINYLNEHELVREELGGTPLLVSW